MRRCSFAVLLAALVLASLPSSASARLSAGRAKCPAPGAPMKFAKQGYVDMTRAGGEPTIETHPDGTLLYGAHAGTTHFYSFAAADADTSAFLRNYTGQAYYYYSKDNGKTWEFSERLTYPKGLPGSGFSDPEFAIDAAGNVYISEINLINIAVSKSNNSGKDYELQNFFAFTITDRQWQEADQKDVLYMVGNTFGGGTFPYDPVGNTGHILIKSKDGGKTFSEAIPDRGGFGDIQVDKRDGTVYEAHRDGGKLTMHAFRHARHDNFKPDVATIADGVSMLSHWPSFDIDAKGNLYITWDEDGSGKRAAGVYYSYSTDRGKTWAEPLRVDGTDETDLWPWLAVGATGRVAVAWLQASEKLPDHNVHAQGDHTWKIVMAQSLNGLGCAQSDTPGFRTAVATPDPVHTGTICNSGTICQARGIDRRLGDYFTIEITKDGRVWAGYSDTRQGGAVALPGFVIQKGGPRFGH